VPPLSYARIDFDSAYRFATIHHKHASKFSIDEGEASPGGYFVRRHPSCEGLCPSQRSPNSDGTIGHTPLPIVPRLRLTPPHVVSIGNRVWRDRITPTETHSGFGIHYVPAETATSQYSKLTPQSSIIRYYYGNMNPADSHSPPCFE
jgi:hypothetical protein